jgi:dihydroorotase
VNQSNKILEKRSAYPDQWTLTEVELWSATDKPEFVNIRFEKNRPVAIEPCKNPGKSTLCLIPAGIDIQVHLRVPGQAHKETAEAGLTASLVGGLAAVVTMPNTKPVIDSVESLKLGMEQVAPWEKLLGVRTLFTAALSMGQKGEALCDYRSLADAGVVAFTDDGVGLASDEWMLEALRRLAQVQRPLFQHAETPGHGGVLAPGPAQARLGVKPYSSEPEVSMVRRDLRLLEKVPTAQYHLLHVSCAESVQLIADAKKKGLRATVEVSPHHLWWSTEDIDDKNSSFKMNPPIRTPEDREALQRALQDGCIDWVATDHAPHEASAKTLDFTKAAFGTTGVETSLPVLLALYAQNKLSASRLVETFSTRPAEYLGLSRGDGWGAIEKGAPLRAVIVEKSSPWKIWQADDFHSLSKNSCFIHTRLPEPPVVHFTETGIFALGRPVRFRDGEFTLT